MTDTPDTPDTPDTLAAGGESTGREHGAAGDRWVDDLLRTSLADGPYLEDAGFTERALALLPPPRRRRLRRRDLVVGLSAVAAGGSGALAVVASGGGAALDVSLAAAQANPSSVLGVVVVVGLALWGAFAAAEA